MHSSYKNNSEYLTIYHFYFSISFDYLFDQIYYN